MKKNILKKIKSSYHKSVADYLEIGGNILRELFLGVDCSIFDKTIAYYNEVSGKKISRKKALSIALNKKQHKMAWFKKERKTVEEIMQFYKEVEIYPFRQPYTKRFGGYRWIMNLVSHVKNPAVLEYGCGSAILTEYLINKFPNAKYSVADIPSVTLDFIKWKKEKYGYSYEILTIGRGKEGIPLRDSYDLIICMDVLEHTPNPLEIIQSFTDHLSPNGVLVMDFINHSDGENLEISMKQRETVKKFLKENLIALKPIDEPDGNDGLYVKSVLEK